MREKLKAGTRFNLTVLGHKDFYYPGSDTDTLIEDTTYVQTHYVGGGSKVAVKVPESAVKYDGEVEKNVLIWVEKQEIL